MSGTFDPDMATEASVERDAPGEDSATAYRAALSQRSTLQLSSVSSHCTCNVWPAEAAA